MWKSATDVYVVIVRQCLHTKLKLKLKCFHTSDLKLTGAAKVKTTTLFTRRTDCLKASYVHNNIETHKIDDTVTSLPHRSWLTQTALSDRDILLILVSFWFIHSFWSEVYVSVSPAADVKEVQANITALLSISYNRLSLISDPRSIRIQPVGTYRRL